MGKLSTAITFFTGAAFGGAVVWYITRERYALLAEEEINSVKETYAQMQEKAAKAMWQYQGADEEDTKPEDLSGGTPAVTAKVPEKRSITEYAERIKNGESMDYSKTVVPSKQEIQGEPENFDEHPYVISPEEFSELDDYATVSLTCFADGVLADEHGVIVDNVEEMVGDALEHFGEYEEDSVFVRNDAKRCDYEILRDENTYEEFRKTLPSKI